jgi:hypothetical protein
MKRLAFLLAFALLSLPASASETYLGTIRGWSLGNETQGFPLASSGPQYILPAPPNATSVEVRNVTMRWVEPWKTEWLNPNLPAPGPRIYYVKHDHLWWHTPPPYENTELACIDFTNAPIQDVPDLTVYDGETDGDGTSGYHATNDWSNLNLAGPFQSWGPLDPWKTIDATGLHPLWYAPHTIAFFSPAFPDGHWFYQRKIRSMMRAEVWALTP